MYDLLAMEEIDSESGNHQGKQKKKEKIFFKRAESVVGFCFNLHGHDIAWHGLIAIAKCEPGNMRMDCF